MTVRAGATVVIATVSTLSLTFLTALATLAGLTGITLAGGTLAGGTLAGGGLARLTRALRSRLAGLAGSGLTSAFTLTFRALTAVAWVTIAVIHTSF